MILILKAMSNLYKTDKTVEELRNLPRVLTSLGMACLSLFNDALSTAYDSVG
jgi:hypothetical protein